MKQNLISSLTYISYAMMIAIGTLLVFLKSPFEPSQRLHILISIASFGILGLAGIQALILHLQNRTLRTNPKSTFLRYFPPIESMEAFLFKTIVIGFICLSFSLLSAFVFTSSLYTVSHLHKISLSFLAWIFFAILLYKHHQAGWRGKTAVRWTLLGIAVLLVAYFSSKLILFNIGINDKGLILP
jgi:ABC-type uncharacterized transport system permease subunit